jgi:sigma-B regulation protein RsbU (phosphoserine phosphatase)
MTITDNDNVSGTTLVLKNLFKRLSPADIDALRQVATARQYPAGTVLCQQGAVERVFYVLRTGAVTITQRLSDTEEQLIAYRNPGEFFGEMALIDNSPRSATVTAITAVDVLEIDEATFGQVLRNSPELALTLLHNSLAALRNSMHRQIGELQAKNAELRQAYAELQAAEAELIRNERMQRDLELAAHVQRGLLPKTFPHLAGVSFAARAQPAREIGGDFYDAFQLDEKHVGVLIADVSDKSIHAAIFMAIARALFHTEVRRTLSPREVVGAVHQLLLDVSSEDDMFVTAFYGVLHLDTRHLTYVRAGHDRPLVLHRDGTYNVLEGAGRFIGMLDDLKIEEYSIDLHRGDRLIMVSDGIVDARNAADERYGADRLAEVVKSCAGAAAETLATTIMDQVLAFQGDAPQFDDITLLVAAIE